MRLNLQNQTLKVAVNVSPPFVFLKLNSATQAWEPNGGLEIKLLNQFKEYFNFSYELINCNSVWGSKLENNTWTGIIGMLYEKKADIGIGGISLNYERSQALPILYPHIFSSVTFITSAPRIEPNIYLVFKPLSLNVWICFILAILISICFDQLYNRVSDARNNAKVFWIDMYSVFRQQYESYLPSTISFRLWSIVWSMSTFILTTGYAGCLCSLITIPIKMKTIDTKDELVQAAIENKIIVSSIKNSVFFDIIAKSPIPNSEQFGKLLTSVHNKDEGIELVRKSDKKYAFISSREYLLYMQQIYGEDVIYIPDEGNDATLCLDMMTTFFRVSFPYTTQLNQFVKQIESAGLINHWRKQEFSRAFNEIVLPKLPNTQTIQDSNSEFTISQLQSFFFIYLFSAFVSIVCFIAELASYYFHISPLWLTIMNQ